MHTKFLNASKQMRDKHMRTFSIKRKECVCQIHNEWDVVRRADEVEWRNERKNAKDTGDVNSEWSEIQCVRDDDAREFQTAQCIIYKLQIYELSK